MHRTNRFGDLDSFAEFCTAESKGHFFEIKIKKQKPTSAYWRIAVISRGSANYGNAYAAADILRASITINDPLGYLMFRCNVRNGIPHADIDFQCKFGILEALNNI